MSKAAVKKIIKASNGIGYMATIDGSTPRVRPMAVSVGKDGVLLTTTFTRSPKMKQLTKNSRVEICFCDEGMQQVRLTGRAKVIKDAKKKASFFKKSPDLKRYFKSVDDPNYTLLEVKPTKVMLMMAGQMKYAKVKW